MEAVRTRRPVLHVLREPAERGGRVHVGQLVSSTAAVRPIEPVREVAELFFRDPGLGAVALVEGGRPEGLLTRNRLLLALARAYGKELWGRRPVSRIADLAAIVVQEDAEVPAAIARALSRPVATVWDELVVARQDGTFAGIVGVRELVLHQSVALARSSAEREAAEGRARDLEKLERMRSQFLAHATHELRSPVNAIVALAELLRMQLANGNLASLPERLTLLLRSATGLRGTVNNILDLSRLEAGRTEVTLTWVELSPLLEEIGAMTRLLVGDRPIRVEVWVEAGLAVTTDRQKLRQMIVNLASNAAKFTDEGLIVLSAQVAGGDVRVSVEDTGIGIREEDQELLFEPFGQLEDALTKAHEGSGLGLVITRSLARLIGATVAVESRHGDGSRFELRLPCNPSSAAKERSA